MSRIKLTVIGECSGTPISRHATSCYLVEYDDFPILMDIGSGALSILGEVISFDRISHVIISHSHADHIADAGVAIYSRLISMQLGKSCDPLFFHAEEDHGYTYENVSSVVHIDETVKEEIGPFHVSYCRTKHPVATLAMKLEAGGKSIVYTADGTLTDALCAFSKNSDLLISECSFYPGKGNDDQNHMNPEKVVKLATTAKPEKLLVSHLPVYGERKEILTFIEEHYDGPAMLAYPKKEIIL